MTEEQRAKRMDEIVEEMFGDKPFGHDWTDEQWAAHEAIVQRERAEAEAKREAQRQKELRERLAEAGCPLKDLERALKGELEDTRALDEVGRFFGDETQRILVLSGLRGCGKTTAAAWWLCQKHPSPALIRTEWPMFIDAPRLARWPRYDDAKMLRLERATALVVDDLGVEYDDDKGNFRSTFDALVNSRYASCLPTAITTNLPAKAFRERYGERVADRIREVGRFVELGGESLRGRR